MTTTIDPTETTPAAATPRPLRRRGLHFTGKMMAPGILLLAALSIIPALTLLAMSFSRVRLLGGVRLEWVGLDNWARLLSDVDVWTSWGRMAIYLIATLGLEMVLGLAIALGLYRVARARGSLLALLLLPMFVAPVIVGLLGRYLTDSTFGLYTFLLGKVGAEGDPLGGTTTAFIAIVAMDVWEWTPLITLIALAGLTGVNESVLEASSLDGASQWATLRHILLPSIANVLLVALLIRAMDAVRYFDIITITTNGGPADATKIIPIRLYESAFRFFDIGYAATIGLSMLVVTIIIARAFVRMLDTKGLTR